MILDLLSHPAALRTVGYAIVLGVAVHVLLSAWRAWLDLRFVRRQNELRLRQLMAHVESQTLHRQIEQQRAVGGWSGSRKFRVERVVDETADVRSFYLVPHDGRPLPMFHPGQYLTLRVNLPGRSKPLVRCYSLSDSPQQREHYRISVKRLLPPADFPEVGPGAASDYFHAHIGVGDILDIKAPAGNFCVDLAQHSPLVLVAGGIGITPVFCMLKAIFESASQRELWLFYGVRNSGELCFAMELRDIAARMDNLHLVLCFDDPLPGDCQGSGGPLSGRVTIDLLRQMLPSSNFQFLVCGPPPMMADLCAGLRDWGVPDNDVRTEAFGPASVKRIERPINGASHDYTVTFARSGRALAWDGADNLLEFAEAHGIVLESGCRAGGCGTCMTAVKDGSVEYAHTPDAQPEAGSCLACVARPRSNLVLDA